MQSTRYYLWGHTLNLRVDLRHCLNIAEISPRPWTFPTPINFQLQKYLEMHIYIIINFKLSIPKVRVVKSAFLRVVLQGKEVWVYEHAPTNSAQYDEAVTGERFIEVEYLPIRRDRIKRGNPRIPLAALEYVMGVLTGLLTCPASKYICSKTKRDA